MDDNIVKNLKTDSLTPPEVRRRGFPFGLKFIIVFFFADAAWRVLTVLMLREVREASGVTGFFAALFASRAALVFLFIGIFDVLLALQLSARMVAGRVWAIVFSVLQILNLLFDPFSRQVFDISGVSGRIQVIVGAGAFIFTIYYCMRKEMRDFLIR